MTMNMMGVLEPGDAISFRFTAKDLDYLKAEKIYKINHFIDVIVHEVEEVN